MFRRFLLLLAAGRRSPPSGVPAPTTTHSASWSSAIPGPGPRCAGMPMGVAYLSITNRGTTPDALIARELAGRDQRRVPRDAHRRTAWRACARSTRDRDRARRHGEDPAGRHPPDAGGPQGAARARQVDPAHARVPRRRQAHRGARHRVARRTAGRGKRDDADARHGDRGGAPAELAAHADPDDHRGHHRRDRRAHRQRDRRRRRAQVPAEPHRAQALHRRLRSRGAREPRLGHGQQRAFAGLRRRHPAVEPARQRRHATRRAGAW